MRSCEDDGDCRGGKYRCLDVAHDESRRIVDTNPPSRRICAIPSSGDATKPLDPAVCFPSDASFDVSRPEAGPTDRDVRADDGASESSSVDRADEPSDASGADTSADGPGGDAVDSSSVETGTDDGAEGETGPTDAADEPGVDALSPP